MGNGSTLSPSLGIGAPRAAAAPRLAAAEPSPAQVRLFLLGLGLATGMEFYSNDSMNLILPDIAGTIGVSFDEASWLLTVYSCSLFFGVPVSIWMERRFGYRRFLIGTIVVFAVTAAAGPFAPDFATMLLARAIQGFAGAGLYVWWRASIYMLLSKAQRSASLMQVSTMLYLSSAAGLLASGYITDHFNWRLAFLPNLVYALGAIALLLRSIPSTAASAPAARADRTDVIGIALLALALVSLQIALNRGQIDDWFDSAFIQRLAWTSVVAAVLFVFWQTSPHNGAPLLQFDLLRDRRVLSSALIGVFSGIILSGSLYALPEFLRNIDPEPHSATRTGQVMCAYALAAAAIRPLVLPLVARIGQRKTIALALVMLVASMLLFVRLLTTGTPDAAYIAPLVLYAFCLAPLLPAVGSGTVGRVEQARLLDGVSLYMTFRQFGASIGVALLTILIEQRETLHSSRLFEHLRTASVTTGDWLLRATAIFASRGGESAIEARHMATKLLAVAGSRQAATLAYADAFLFMALIGAAALCLVPIIPPTPTEPKK
jgi:DHA2 family multidrug resistance protein